MKIYHVKTHEDGWAVEAEGAQRPDTVEGRKADAVKRGREVAQSQQPARLIVHKQDGSVQDRITYGEAEARDARPANDAVYALAALAKDALELASEALALARELPAKAQQRSRELSDLGTLREELAERLRELRDTVEERIEEKSAEGRTVTDELLSDGRVQRVLDQARNAQTQIKAALTSIRKGSGQAADTATAAGKEQAKAAKSQVKAAATSVRKTAKTAADAAEDAAS